MVTIEIIKARGPPKIIDDNNNIIEFMQILNNWFI